MGKFSSGMKKYGNRLGSAFTSDKDEKKRIKKENKLTHAERLAITPVSMIVDPLILIPVGVGTIVVGVGAAALGVLAIPVGLVGKILIGKGNGLMAVGGGMVLGGGVIIIAGGVVSVEGVISPVIDLLSTPYNGYKAFKHRDRTEHSKDIKEYPKDVIETVVDQSSHAKMGEQLGGAVNDANINNALPTHTPALFEAKNDAEGPEHLKKVEAASVSPSM